MGKTQADQPHLGRPAGTSAKSAPSSIQELCDTFVKPLNRGSQVGLIKWIKRPSTWIKGPTCCAYPDLLARTTSLDFIHMLIKKSVKRRAETCRTQAGRLTNFSFKLTQLSTTIYSPFGCRHWGMEFGIGILGIKYLVFG